MRKRFLEVAPILVLVFISNCNAQCPSPGTGNCPTFSQSPGKITNGDSVTNVTIGPMANGAQLTQYVDGSLGQNADNVSAANDSAVNWTSLPDTNQDVTSTTASTGKITPATIANPNLLGGTVSNPVYVYGLGDPASLGCTSTETDAYGNAVPVTFCTKVSFSTSPPYNIMNSITVVNSTATTPSGAPITEDPSYLEKVLTHENVHGIEAESDCKSGSDCANSATNNVISSTSPTEPTPCDGVGVEDASGGQQGEPSDCVCFDTCQSTCMGYSLANCAMTCELSPQGDCSDSGCPGYWDASNDCGLGQSCGADGCPGGLSCDSGICGCSDPCDDPSCPG